MTRRTVHALVTPQWRDTWEKIEWNADEPNGRPLKQFLTFVMRASELRELSGVFRRNPQLEGNRVEDGNIQRPHDSGRSREIRRFVDFGYPMSTMTASQLEKAGPGLQRPGWLPTAIVLNILREGEIRDGLRPLSEEQAVKVPSLSGACGGAVVELGIPQVAALENDRETPPFEVIDGQHRLWGFDDDDDTDDFFLPVVAFVDLSKAHQAYLFWSINIKPKKINTSLAFDLYPLLRSEEWLMSGEGLKVYRESRAQELTEALWMFPDSPWYDRINMIGARGVGESMPVSQASFVRSLQASFIRAWSNNKQGSGGLFGSDNEGGLDWNRAQQAAYLIAAWQEVFLAIEESDAGWFEALKEAGNPGETPDPIGRHSMLGSDQGVRAVSIIVNELSYNLSDEMNLREWQMPPAGDAVDTEQIQSALSSLESTGFRPFLRAIGESLAQFDWRTPKAPGIEPEQERSRSIYRGSGGYVKLRRDMLDLLVSSEDRRISDEASKIVAAIGSEDV